MYILCFGQLYCTPDLCFIIYKTIGVDGKLAHKSSTFVSRLLRQFIISSIISNTSFLTVVFTKLSKIQLNTFKLSLDSFNVFERIII